jgi:hypothetical protein
MTEADQAEPDNNISFVIGRGNQSSICGAITPMIVVDPDPSAAEGPAIDKSPWTERSS